MLERVKKHIEDDWRNAWKWLSVQAAALLAFGSLAYEFLPAFRDFVAPYVDPRLFAAFGTLVILARLKKQGGNNGGQ